MDNLIYNSLESKTQTFIYKNHIISTVTNLNRAMYHSFNNIFIFTEGIIFNRTNTNLAHNLINEYIAKGETFINHLRGSFQLLILDARHSEERVFIYADPTASRQLFYADSRGALCFAPDIQALIPLLERKTLNPRAMTHFMVSGHFPSGLTALEEIRVLGPGEYLACTREGFQKRSYYKFRLNPDEGFTEVEASRALDSALDEAILRHWRQAEEPAILLSGGYDSQFIFFTIARSVEDTGRLTTVTWGQNPAKPRADMEIARRTARRFGTRHIEIQKTTDRCLVEYDEMFKAQSGMTDSSFYHANELSVCRTLRERYGIKSLLRGDECLGYGPDVLTVQDALSLNGMGFPEQVVGMRNWFQQPEEILEDYSVFLLRLVQSYDCSSPNELKDTIDFHERQFMNRNPLNYYKLHYQEVFCPLLDVDVLEVVSKFPARFRRHKSLFKKLLIANFGRHVRIAEETNLIDWREAMRRSVELQRFFHSEIQDLPHGFNGGFFEGLVHSINTAESRDRRRLLANHLKTFKKILPMEAVRCIREQRNHRIDQVLNIPAHFLLIRAAVLARWNRWRVDDTLSRVGGVLQPEPIEARRM